MKRDYYLLKSGRLRRKENTIYLETSDGKIPIPINDVNSILAFGELDVNSKLLVFLAQQKVPVHFFNYYGFYEFYSIATDIAGNVEAAPERADTACGVVIPTTVDIDPDTLNLKSKGRWVTVYIELPEGYDVASIDVATILLQGAAAAELKPTEVGDYDCDGAPGLMVKFDRSAVQDILEPGEVELAVTGICNSILRFKGSDVVMVIG